MKNTNNNMTELGDSLDESSSGKGQSQSTSSKICKTHLSKDDVLHCDCENMS